MAQLHGTGRLYKRFAAGVIPCGRKTRWYIYLFIYFYFLIGKYEGDEAEATPHWKISYFRSPTKQEVALLVERRKKEKNAEMRTLEDLKYTSIYFLARVACWLLGVALCFAQRACCESLLVSQTTICLLVKKIVDKLDKDWIFFTCPKEKNQNSNAKIEAGSGRSLCKKKRLSAEDARTSVRRINWQKKIIMLFKNPCFF